MALSSLNLRNEKTLTSSWPWNNTERGMSCQFMNNESLGGSSQRRSTTKCPKSERDNKKSPYLEGVQLKPTEKRMVYTRESSVVSSFPLAANIYKANSDEFKAFKRTNKGKKVKKSVLTLPNVPAPTPQECTISDTNDSGYLNRVKLIDVPRPKLKKRSSIRKKQKCPELQRLRTSDSSISSYEMLRRLGGDMARKGKSSNNSNETSVDLVKSSDVWAMLRNMNRFEYEPSPPISESSIVTTKKVVNGNRKPDGRYKPRLIETCHTEQIEFISNYDIATKTSKSSSFDRITVIDREEVIQEICNKFSSFTSNNVDSPRTKKTTNSNKNKPFFKNDSKTILSLVDSAIKSLKTEKRKINKNRYTKRDKTAGTKIYADVKSSNNNKEDAKKIEPIISGKSEIREESDYVTKENCQEQKPAITLFTKCDINKKKDVKCNSIDSSKSESQKTTKNLPNENPLYAKDRQKFNESKKKTVFNESAKLKDQRKEYSNEPLEEASTSKDLVKTEPAECLNKNTKVRLTIVPPLLPINMFTQSADIKRKLALIRFPLVILDKDQLGSTFQVQTSDYSQFDGLEKNIWPFMTQWIKKVDQTRFTKNRNQKNTRILQIKHNEVDPQKRCVSLTQQSNKPKPTPLKDKMVKLLYKNFSMREEGKNKVAVEPKIIKCDPKKNKCESKKPLKTTKPTPPNSLTSYLSKRPLNPTPKILDASTETEDADDSYDFELPCTFDDDSRQDFNKYDSKRPTYTALKPHRAKDFIENIINKIKSGIYYNQEEQFDKNYIDTKDAGNQTSFPMNDRDNEVINTFETKRTLDVVPENTFNFNGDDDPLKSITGFDDTLPALKIQTLNKNTIVVKHCVTDVILCFDVIFDVRSMLTESRRSLTCIPVTSIFGDSKSFKCKTTILNAMLPAELCSILPELMQKLMKIDNQLQNHNIKSIEMAAPSTTVISKLSELKNVSPCTLPLIPIVRMSPEVKNICIGTFASRLKLHTTIMPINKISNICSDGFLSISRTSSVFIDFVEPSRFKTRIESFTEEQNQTKFPVAKTLFDCKSLTPYVSPKETLAMIFSKCRGNKNIIPLKLYKRVEDIAVNYSFDSQMNIPNEKRLILTFSGTIRDEFLYKEKNKIIGEYTNEPALKCVDHLIESTTNNKHARNDPILLKNKFRKKGFIKLYKRCKSTSNMTGERCCTALTKITNMDKFFQALGSGKTLCSVFDQSMEKKILLCLNEMCAWVTEISPRQTLLILLLLNKKETPSLLKFRPVLLQAIAVNRITRSSELDMEIEVIERENFNRFSHVLDAVSYPMRSKGNYDNLLEELIWVAKTTASDYQKPFDETSEKLLKALLEKRKKLNPSYLRVMARYVGLGLLKLPKK